jgi:hypothetical protein
MKARKVPDAVGIALLVVAFGAAAQSDFTAVVAALATFVAVRQR